MGGLRLASRAYLRPVSRSWGVAPGNGTALKRRGGGRFGYACFFPLSRFVLGPDYQIGEAPPGEVKDLGRK